jgi:hypothetical protein
MSSVNYSIGTEQQYDALPLLPAIGTLSGGIRLGNNVRIGAGGTAEFDGLRFNEPVLNASRFITDSLNFAAPRLCTIIFTNATIISDATSVDPNARQVTIVPNTIPVANYSKVDMTIDQTADLGTIFMRGNNLTPSRAFSKSFRFKSSAGNVVYKWLDQVSDYKSTPPNASIVGTLQWYKLATNGNEINNYLTGNLLHNALTTTPPTQPVMVYVLDRDEDVSMIQSSYNGQPVTISDEFAGGLSTSFDFGFNFNF